MCGVHGFCWKDQNKSIDGMIEEAKHRGPDGSGSWGDPYITLGHNLLSIVDTPVVSSQPWKHENYVMVYNGEIYNYKDLKSSLGGEFKTDTDTEVLIAGYAKQGKQFLHKIDGMFAVAIYNTSTKKLLLARDSNGAKPLYYGYINNKLAFSSEISSLLSLGFERTVSSEGLKHYLHSGMTTGPVTCFKNIYRLVPGQILEIDLATGVKFSSNLNDTPVEVFRGKETDLPELIHEKFKQAVGLTLMGRRNLGVFLSGGLDSSAVVYEMVKSLNINPNTFSTRFDAPIEACFNDDADLAKRLSGLYKIENTSVTVSEQDWVDNINRTARALEEPRQGRSYPAYYLTNRLLKNAGTVVTLSGDGGDELFGGYDHYFKFKSFKARMSKLNGKFGAYRNTLKKITIREQVDYLRGWLPRGGITGDAINDYMYTDSLCTLSEDFLIRNDKLGMAFGMEARFPFMCSVFKNFVRGIPSAIKCGAPNKILLRSAYTNRLPDFIMNKNKTGWRAPTDEWDTRGKVVPYSNSPFTEYIMSVMSLPETRDIFEIATDAEAKRVGGKRLFAIVMFMAWYRQFKMSI